MGMGDSNRAGIGWLLLIGLPPVLILAGLIALVAWQASKGGISPKWKEPPPPSTNVAPAPAIRRGFQRRRRVPVPHVITARPRWQGPLIPSHEHSP
jgi:hypothetical protein